MTLTLNSLILANRARITRSLLHATVLSSFVCLGACTQGDPPGSEGTSETGGDSEVPDGSEVTSYYPLVDGANWTYLQKTLGGQVTGTEVVNATADTWDSKDVIVLTDNTSANGNFTQSYIYRDGSSAVRIHKILEHETDGPYTIVDYDPGFMRADDAWDSVGDLGELMYTRTETDGAGAMEDIEMRGHNFEIISLSESVTVPAGVFNCVHVQRVRTTGVTAGETVDFWYASGIGKVREERTAEDKVEELVSVSIPGGKSFP